MARSQNRETTAAAPLRVTDLVEVAEARGGFGGMLDRAVHVAPRLIAEGGISAPFSLESREYGKAVEMVMGAARVAEVQAAESQIGRVADVLRDQLQAAGFDDVSALQMFTVWPRQDAAYALGLAVGLLFARGLWQRE